METHMIFETHAHYDDEAFEQDREALLNSMEAHGIGHIVNACASIESLKATEELMEIYPSATWIIFISCVAHNTISVTTLPKSKAQSPSALAVCVR